MCHDVKIVFNSNQYQIFLSYLEYSEVIFLCVAKSSNNSLIVLLYGYRFDVKLEIDEKALLDKPKITIEIK